MHHVVRSGLRVKGSEVAPIETPPTTSQYEIIVEKIFPDAQVGGGAGGINAICSRPEIADDVISGYDVYFSVLPCYEFVSC